MVVAMEANVAAVNDTSNSDVVSTETSSQTGSAVAAWQYPTLLRDCLYEMVT